MHKPVVLIVLDGWGIGPPGPGNALTQAKLTEYPKLLVSYPHTQIDASGEAVGLPKGEDGNTETGHLNLGAGRIVYQDLPRINMAIADGSFFTNPAFLGAIEHVRNNGSKLHLLGLIGAGGVHSNIEHLYALLQLLQKEKLEQTYLHLITDGRDSPPTSVLTYLSQVRQEISKSGVGKIASIMGRYYAMDRDHRWERTEAAYRVLTEGFGKTANSPEEVIWQSYPEGKTDEFIEPTIIMQNNAPVATISDNDAVIFFNFRIDRPRQLTKAFVLPDFSTASKEDFDPYAIKYYKKHIVEASNKSMPFKRTRQLRNLFFVTMTEYERELPVVIAFPPQSVTMPLGKVIANAGKRQLRMAETEKERFVTYYFNGQRDDAFYGEDRIIIPSPKVPTYDQKPEMAAQELTDTLISRIDAKMYDFILINFANADMVGHTGVVPAAIHAVEFLDQCLGRIIRTTLSVGGACIITADHGNVEEMLDTTTGGTDTEHSTYPVPFIAIAQEYQGYPQQIQKGVLADIAPSVLHLLNIPKPSTMTGRNLLVGIREH